MSAEGSEVPEGAERFDRTQSRIEKAFAIAKCTNEIITARIKWCYSIMKGDDLKFATHVIVKMSTLGNHLLTTA